MALAALLALACLFKRLDAGPVPPPNSDRPCHNFILPVQAEAQHAEYDIIPVGNNVNASAFAVDVDTWSFNLQERLIRNLTVSDTFEISVQLCIPPGGAKKTSLFIATHGGLFDKRYWDPAINPSEYSFVSAALAQGYSILTYDRLGTGLSSKPDAYTTVQAPIQLEILRHITEMARSGDLLAHLPTTSRNTTAPASFDKIIHVGHSFGSVLTTALLATYGALSDAAVITGFIPNPYFAEMRKTSFDLEYARDNDPALFADRGPGYMVDGTRGGFQNVFFSARADAESGVGGFDPAVFDYAFGIRQTITTSEFLPPTVNLGAAPEFRGPLQYVLAEWDFPVCQGDCREVYDRGVLEGLYPGATDIDIQTQKGNGHALTMHRGARAGYRATFEWLGRQGF